MTHCGREKDMRLLIKLLLIYGIFSTTLRAANVEWIVAQSGETQVQACHRNNWNPLNNGDLQLPWNSSVMESIVTTVLNRTVLVPNNGYGTIGCCAPGLWCTEDGCFTQGFGDQFVNYGWLNDNSAAFPVYTCSGIKSITGTVDISDATLSDGQLSLHGDSFPSSSSSSAAYVYGEECSELESCTCHTCSEKSPCAPGNGCWVRDEGSYCFQLCAGYGDESCPCDYTCTAVSGSGSDTISFCLPQNFQSTYATYFDQCVAHSGHMTCQAPRAYQSQYKTTAASHNDKVTVSLAVENDGSVDANAAASDIASGFCKSDADCADGNICTIDSCHLASGLCRYTSVEGCDSILPTVRGRQTPYMYYSYYAQSNKIAKNQKASVKQLLKEGTVSSASNTDDTPLQEVELPFTVVYFGNKVSTGFISPNGILALPPLAPCNDLCFLLTSGSNVISPYYSDWNPTDGTHRGQIVYYTQKASDPAIWGVKASAFHVLYDGLVPYGYTGSKTNTFALSLYNDGSVRLSYVSIHNTAKANNYFGIWGAYASSYDAEDSTNLRYHQEVLSKGDVVSGSEALYCSLGALGCPMETCLGVGDVLVVRWEGATTCSALGSVYKLQLTCSFAGGLASSEAELVEAGDEFEYTTVQCDVPKMANFTDGTVISVDVVVAAVRVDGSSSAYTENSGDLPGSKTIYAAYQGKNDEIARSSLMIRYYANTSVDGTTIVCGCNALPTYSGLQCDAIGVCGGDNSTADCAGVAFGAAISTVCNTCAGGMTGVIPQFNCDDSGGSNLNEIVSQTIILLMVICCLTFLTMSVSYSIRRMLALRAMRDDLTRFNEQLAMAEQEVLRRHMGLGGAISRGLSEFERDALGEVTFTKEFYEKHKRELAEALHGKDGKDSKGDKAPAEPAVAGDIETPTPLPAGDACECTICLMEIEEGNKCRVLPAPCGHIFHVACIDQWFQQSFLCPLCKRSIRALLLGNDEAPPASDYAMERDAFLHNLLILRPNVAIRFTPAVRTAPVTRPAEIVSSTRQTPSSTPSPPVPATGSSGAAELLPTIRYARQQRVQQHQQRAGGRPFSPNRSAGSSASLLQPSPTQQQGDVELTEYSSSGTWMGREDGISSVATAGDGRSQYQYAGMRNSSNSEDARGSDEDLNP